MTTDFRVISRLAHRVRSDRRMAGLAATGLLGAVLVPILPATSAAAATCQTKPYTATANARLVKAEVLDPGPLGSDAAAVADVTVAWTHSDVDSTAKRKTFASADYLDAEVLGNDVAIDPFDESVSQSAPPDAAGPAVAEPAQIDNEYLTAGPGHLTADARWEEGFGCRKESGLLTQSFGSDLDAAILPGSGTEEGSGDGEDSDDESASSQFMGDGLAKLPSNAFSQTATELVKHKNVMATRSTAWIGLANVTLFDDTEHEVLVKVINSPELTAYATGSPDSSSVTYTAPLLEVVMPDGTSHRIDSPGESVEVNVPLSGSSTESEAATEDDVAPSEEPGSPESGLLDPAPGVPTPSDGAENPLDSLLEGLTGQSQGGSGGTAVEDTEGEERTESTESAESAEAAEAEQPAEESAEQEDRTLSVHIGIGEMESAIDDESVSGEAASIRLRAAVVEGSEQKETVADLGLGLLDVAATAPPTKQDKPPVKPEPEPDRDLPTTGLDILRILAAAAVVLSVGLCLLVLARRRFNATVEPADG